MFFKINPDSAPESYVALQFLFQDFKVVVSWF